MLLLPAPGTQLFNSSGTLCSNSESNFAEFTANMPKSLCSVCTPVVVVWFVGWFCLALFLNRNSLYPGPCNNCEKKTVPKWCSRGGWGQIFQGPSALGVPLWSHCATTPSGQWWSPELLWAPEHPPQIWPCTHTKGWLNSQCPLPNLQYLLVLLTYLGKTNKNELSLHNFYWLMNSS